ncbi:copper amine oxidase [Paenibacillus paridis]|uniref:copper amine oxidase n=1 Tax=Paenibacillus paridis TaxID=2583376 RepID=UPI00111CBB70|nr:copper amine oxidase [Paenibacillus paridis]
MMRKKLIIISMALLLSGGSLVAADKLFQKVTFVYNNKTSSEEALLVDDKVYINIRSLSDSLQAFIQWKNSEKKLVIQKPNVHMFLMNEKRTMFGQVDKGTVQKFLVQAQIDNLNVALSEFKVTLVDPNDKETTIDSRSQSDDDFKEFLEKDTFWFSSKVISYDFKYAGKYKLRFYMEQKNGDPQLISEKVITAK